MNQELLTKDFKRDTRTNALLNTKNDELAAYKLKKKKAREASSMIEDIKFIKKEIETIKIMLKEIINGSYS